MASQFRTIYDMMDAYYNKGSPYYAEYAQALGFDIKKTDYTNSTSGLANVTFGKTLWAQYNQEANAFGILPKYPWNRSGFRAQTVRAAAAGVGVADNAALSTAVVGTFVEATVTAKTAEVNFAVSMLKELLAKSGDDSAGDVESIRPIMAQNFKESANIALLTTTDTVASNNFESIDRVCSSYAEIAAQSYNANDADIYGLDRDAGASWTDAQVVHNSGTDRPISADLLRTLHRSVRNGGGDPTVCLTGWDTYADFCGLFESQQRFNSIPEIKVKYGVNGIESLPGAEAGVNVGAYLGIPVVQSKNVVADTISRFYMLDTSDPEGSGIPRLGFATLLPIQYYEGGYRSGTLIEHGTLQTRAAFVMCGELYCRYFVGQGKLEDLT